MNERRHAMLSLENVETLPHTTTTYAQHVQAAREQNAQEAAMFRFLRDHAIAVSAGSDGRAYWRVPALLLRYTAATFDHAVTLAMLDHVKQHQEPL